MIRKTLKMMVLTAAVLGGTGFLMFGTDLPSYAKTMFSSVREGMEEQIPIELQLKRAESLIGEVDPQIETCKRDVAHAEVDLEELLSSVANLEKVVTKEQQQLQNGARRLGDAAVDNASFGTPRDTLSRRRVERSLQRKLDSYRNNLAILQTKRSLIERQSEAVEVAKQRLVAVRAQKEELADMIRSLRTQKQWIETMAASQSNFTLDDSALSQAKEALAGIQKRLDVKQKMLENEVLYHGDDAVALIESDRDVLAEIRETLSAASTGGELMIIGR